MPESDGKRSFSIFCLVLDILLGLPFLVGIPYALMTGRTTTPVALTVMWLVMGALLVYSHTGRKNHRRRR
jgi:hypothetical protein